MRVARDGRRAAHLGHAPLHVFQVEDLDLVEAVAAVVATEQKELAVDAVERVAGPGGGQLLLSLKGVPFPGCSAWSNGGSARFRGSTGRPATPGRRGRRARIICCRRWLCSGCFARRGGPPEGQLRARCLVLYQNSIYL